VGAGQGRDARRRTVKSATLRLAIQKLATARSMGTWFAIGDSSTHLRSTKCVRVRRSEIRKTALSLMVLICRHISVPLDFARTTFSSPTLALVSQSPYLLRRNYSAAPRNASRPSHRTSRQAVIWQVDHSQQV
jgi:hypothetical protein